MTTIGIDLGADRLRVAVGRDQGPVSIDHDLAHQHLPRVVQASGEGSGERTAPIRISSLKRLLDFESTISVPPGRMVKSLDYLAGLLREMGTAVGGSVDGGAGDCVLAVPPCFSQRQRSALRTAAARAGMARVRLVNDTLAALQASGESLSGYDSIMVFSWGASACSVSVYRARNGAFFPAGQDGDPNLGGDDADGLIAGLILKTLENSLGAGWRDWGLDPDRLAQAAEKAKRLLGQGKSPSFLLGDLFGLRLVRRLRRQPVKIPGDAGRNLIAGLVSRTLKLAGEAMEASGLPRPDAVLLTGGMTRLPAIREALAARYDVPLHDASEEAVAVGSVLYGYGLTDGDWMETASVETSETTAPETVSPPVTPGEPATGSAGRVPAPRWADHFTPLLDRAQRLEAEGRIAEVLQTFEGLFAELFKFSGPIYRQVASTAKDEGRLEDAVGILGRANFYNPSDGITAANLAEACFQLGVSHYKGRDYQAALEQAGLGARVLQQLRGGREAYRPMLAALSHLGGLALYALGSLPDAEKALAEAVALYPEQKRYQEDLAMIRKAAGQAAGQSSSKEQEL